MNNHKKNHLKGFLFNMLRIFCLFHFHVQKKKKENLNSPTEKNDEKKKPGFTLKKKEERQRCVLYAYICL